jgi:hypothetical protein
MHSWIVEENGKRRCNYNQLGEKLALSYVNVCLAVAPNIEVIIFGLVVRVLGYRSEGPGSIPGTTRKKKKVVGLERGALSLVSTTEELLDRKVAALI